MVPTLLAFCVLSTTSDAKLLFSLDHTDPGGANSRFPTLGGVGARVRSMASDIGNGGVGARVRSMASDIGNGGVGARVRSITSGIGTKTSAIAEQARAGTVNAFRQMVGQRAAPIGRSPADPVPTDPIAPIDAPTCPLIQQMQGKLDAWVPPNEAGVQSGIKGLLRVPGVPCGPSESAKACSEKTYVSWSPGKLHSMRQQGSRYTAIGDIGSSMLNGEENQDYKFDPFPEDNKKPQGFFGKGGYTEDQLIAITKKGKCGKSDQKFMSDLRVFFEPHPSKLNVLTGGDEGVRKKRADALNNLPKSCIAGNFAWLSLREESLFTVEAGAAAWMNVNRAAGHTGTPCPVVVLTIGGSDLHAGVVSDTTLEWLTITNYAKPTGVATKRGKTKEEDREFTDVQDAVEEINGWMAKYKVTITGGKTQFFFTFNKAEGYNLDPGFWDGEGGGKGNGLMILPPGAYLVGSPYTPHRPPPKQSEPDLNLRKSLPFNKLTGLRMTGLVALAERR